MPSPDVTPYVDLTLLDVTPDDLAAAAIENLEARLPGWIPREGNTEVALLEAGAIEVAASVYAINRLPGALLEVLLRLFDLERSLGNGAVATVEVTAIDDGGHTIAAGTRFRLDLGDTLDPVDFALDVDLVIDAGDTVGIGAVTGETATTYANGYPAGGPLRVLDSAPIVTATLASSPTGGVDPEDGFAFLERATQRLGRLTETLVLPRHFELYALEQVDVYRAKGLSLYDADTDTAGVTGHMTVAVAGPGGTELSGGRLTELDAAMSALAIGGLEVHVVNRTLTPVDLGANVKLSPGADPGLVEAAVEAALVEFLNPDLWPWSNVVRRNEVIAVVDAVPGVAYVIEVFDGSAVPLVDIVLDGPLDLTEAGVIAVTTTV